MKSLVAIFAVTAAISGGIVFAAASGMFGDSASASNRAKIVRPSDDPRSMDEIRQDILKKKGSSVDSSQIVRPGDDPRTKEQIQAEVLQKLKEQRQGTNPDLAPPTVVVSPEEEAGNFGLSTTPRTSPPQKSTSEDPIPTTPQPELPPAQPGLTKDAVKDIINKRANQ